MTPKVPYREITGHRIPLTEDPAEISRALAARVRERRLDLGWSRSVLAEKAGVSEATIKVFERRGQITVSRLLLIARALGALGGFATLFEAPAARSLEELEGRQQRRQRGRRRR